jgi:hypothetical protein
MSLPALVDWQGFYLRKEHYRASGLGRIEARLMPNQIMVIAPYWLEAAGT